MATTTVLSGGQKDNGGTILHAGNIDGVNITNNLTLAENAHHPDFTNRVVLAVSPLSSGNLGTFKPLTAGVFNSMEVGQYVAKIIGTRIAQTDNTFLRSGAAETSTRRSLHYGKGNRRYDITDWSYINGTATLGGSEGVSFTYHDPVNDTSINSEPLPTNAVPGEFVYMVTGKTATQDDYEARTNP